MVGSEQIEAESTLRVLGADEAGEAAQEAAQVAEEAVRQVGGFEAVTPGPQARLQESDGSLEPLPELLDEVGLRACPAAEEVQGPALGLLDALGLIDPPEILPQPSATISGPSSRPRSYRRPSRAR